MSTAPVAESNTSLQDQFSGIPDEFLADFQAQGIPYLVSYKDKELGEYSAQIVDGNRLRFVNPEALLSEWSLKPAVYDYLLPLMQTSLPVNQPIACPAPLKHICGEPTESLLETTVDHDLMTLSFLFKSDLFKVQKTTVSDKTRYLDTPAQTTPALITSYSLNLSHNDSAETQATLGSIGLNSVISSGSGRLINALYATTSEENGTEVSLDNLAYEYDLQKQRVVLGYSNGYSASNPALTQQQYGFSGHQITATWASSNHGLLSNNNETLIPIVVFINRESTVRVYKDDRLISVQNFNQLGSHSLDTSTLPSGVYPVRIEIFEGSRQVSVREAMINKPFDTSQLDPATGLSYSLWLGAASLTTSSSPKTFDEPYLGGSVGKVMSPYLYSQASGYFVAGIGVAEFNNTLALPLGVNGDASVGFSSCGGYGMNLGLRRFFDIGASVSVSYNNSKAGQTEEPVNTPNNETEANSEINLNPFTSDRESLSLSISGELGDYGQLSLSGSMDLGNQSTYYTGQYSKDLFQSTHLTLSGSLSGQWEDSGNTVNPSEEEPFSFIAMLQLSYRFDDTLSLHANSQYASETQDWSHSSQIAINRNEDNPLISGGSVSVNKSSSDTTLSGTVDFNASQLKGSVFGSHQNNSNTLGANLTGGIVLANSQAVASRQISAPQSSAGIIFQLEGAEQHPMILSLNGAFHEVSEAARFIPLSPYENYTAYLLPSDNSTVNMQWDDSDITFTLYPGNVQTHSLEASEVVLLMGQIISHQHQEGLGGILIKNGRNRSYSDEAGFFQMKVKRGSPTLIMEDPEGSQFTYIFPSQQAKTLKDGQWLGEININTLTL